MKNRNRLFALLPATLLLVSCVDASSLSSGDLFSGSSNSSTEPVDLASFLAKFSSNNCTLSLTGAGSATVSFYGDEGFYAESDDSSLQSGVLVNKNQGLFDFTYEGGAVVLGQAESDATIINDVFYTPSDLAAASEDFSPAGQNVFDVKKTEEGYADVAYAIVGLSQIDTSYSHYDLITDLKLTIDEDGNGASFTFTLPDDKQAYEFTTDVNQIGSTNNAAFSAYMSSPSNAPVRTAYTPESVNALKDLFGESVSVPFPTGLATALFRDDLSYDDEGFLQGITFEEFGTDFSTAFIDQLLAAGYQAVTKSDLFGAYVTYEKPFAAETDTVGASVISFQVAYDEDYDITSGSISSYTYPKTFESADVAKTNEILTAYNGATTEIPLLPSSSDISKVLALDYSSIGNYALDLEADLSVSTYTNCLTYANAYISLLTAAGFTLDYGALETDGFTMYAKDQISVTMALWYNDDDAFDGGFSFYFSDTSPRA